MLNKLHNNFNISSTESYVQRSIKSLFVTNLIYISTMVD